jgi:hypothetical protein
MGFYLGVAAAFFWQTALVFLEKLREKIMSHADRFCFYAASFPRPLWLARAFFGLLSGVVAACPAVVRASDFISGGSFEAGCELDTDNDRLPDCYETGDNRYVSPMRTGTSSTIADTDNDGLSDGDEVLGTVGLLDLPAMGANPLRKTVLIEYDWFDDTRSCGSHSHRPTQAIVVRTAAAFLAMPVINVDGTSGIDLIQDFGQGGLFTGGNLIPDADGDIAGGVNGSEFRGYKNAHFANARFRYFHYAILPHSYDFTTSSGHAERPGDDLIVSLACSQSTSNVTNTILHEIGHNFALHHGGNTACNYKPNYNSVMNYRYQFPGIDTNCTVAGDGLSGYSIGSRPDLDENALNELAGICGLQAGVAVDWNGNQFIEPLVSVDINSSDTSQSTNCGGTRTVLRDFNDHAALNLAHIRSTPDLVSDVIECTNVPPSGSGGPGASNGR